MSQIDAIAKSLLEIVADTALLSTALPGGLSYGSRTRLDSVKPYGLLTVEELEHDLNTSTTRLVSYGVFLRVYVHERVSVAGRILRTFSNHFARIRTLPALNPDEAKLLWVMPGPSDLIEDEDEELGSDVIRDSAAWIFKLQEHQLALA